MKKLGLFMTILLISVASMAQKMTLTQQQQRDLAMAAVKKVERFQENCKLVASDAPYNEKTCMGGTIDIAMQDFLPNAKIKITSLDGKSYSEKKVRRYLLNLALLRKNQYREVKITYYDCAMVSNFVKDVNKSNETGEDWYIGKVTVYQRFNAETKEGVEVHDVVKRTVEVSATLHEIYRKNGSVRSYWDVKLGNINAKSI